MHDEIDPLANIVNEYKVTAGGPGTVYSQFLLQQHARNEPRDYLFEVLARAKRVERPYDRRRNAVGRPIGIDQPVRAALGAGIRTHGIERMRLVHQRPFRGTV